MSISLKTTTLIYYKEILGRAKPESRPLESLDEPWFQKQRKLTDAKHTLPRPEHNNRDA